MLIILLSLLLTSETHGQQQPIRRLELLEEGLVSETLDLKWWKHI